MIIIFIIGTVFEKNNKSRFFFCFCWNNRTMTQFFSAQYLTVKRFFISYVKSSNCDRLSHRNLTLGMKKSTSMVTHAQNKNVKELRSLVSLLTLTMRSKQNNLQISPLENSFKWSFRLCGSFLMAFHHRNSWGRIKIVSCQAIKIRETWGKHFIFTSHLYESKKKSLNR